MQKNKRYTIIISLLFLILSNKGIAQEQDVFSQRIHQVSVQIDSIVSHNKDLLKKEIETIERSRASGEITLEEYEAMKMSKSEFYAVEIEKAVTDKENEIKDILQQKIDGNLKPDAGLLQSMEADLAEKRTMLDVSYNIGINGVNDKKSEFELAGTVALEISGRTKIWKNNPHYFINYGIGFNANYLKPKNDYVLIEDGNQSILVDSGRPLKQSRLDIGTFRLPFLFEYDFASSSAVKKVHPQVPILNSRQSFFMGVGGYIGFTGHKSITQVVRYEEGGKEYVDRHTGNRNINTFLYGVQAQIGYKYVSLYFDYQLNPLFKSNPDSQHIYTVGLKLSWFNVLVN